MRVGITGHCGFIGSNLKSYLLFSGHEVIPLGNCNEDLRDYMSFSGVRYCDVVVHLAGKNRSEDPWLLVDHNVISSYQAARVCAKFNKPLIFTGSDYPHKGHYLASKTISEHIMNTFAENDLLRFCSIRLPKVIGPGCKPHYNSFVSTILYSIAKEEPYEHLINDRSAVLKLVHVDDVCRCISNIIADFGSESEVINFFDMSSFSMFISIDDIIKNVTSSENNKLKEIVEWYRNNDI